MSSKTEPDALVALIAAKDVKDAPVIVAVHLRSRHEFAEVNKIASVYGKEGQGALQEALNNRLLYLDSEKAAEWLHSARLQLPGENTINGPSARRILSPEDIRKGNFYSRAKKSGLTPEETLSARFVRTLQDRYQVLKAVQQNIIKQGGDIDDSNNAWQAEELHHGKAENDLRLMRERHVEPLAKLLAQYRIPQRELDHYLYARHAPERNRYIASINPKMPDGGSGMTNREALQIINRVRHSGKQAQYDRLAGIVDDMLAQRRELIRQSGLEEDAVVDAWQAQYKHYVPLKGEGEDVTRTPTGKGFSVRGSESRQAMGRVSHAHSPSTQAIHDLSASLIRHRKNEVGNTFLKLVEDNPDKDYWQVFTQGNPDTMRRVVNKKDPKTRQNVRTVEDVPVQMTTNADKYFTTKKDGETYYIKLHDPRLMNAMKNMGPETSNVVLQTLGRVNRFLAQLNTSFSPEFVLSNYARDVQTAVLNLQAEKGRDDGKLNSARVNVAGVVKDSAAAMRAIHASLRGKTLTGKGARWQQLWGEFMEDGGKTGWYSLHDPQSQAREMERLVGLAKGGWKGQSVNAFNAFIGMVSNANNAVENSLRLSAYKTARDAGLSRAQAASLAKNMTVNFNRRGEMGTTLNALYMFANASVQGTANMLRALGHLNGQGPVSQRLRWRNLNNAQKTVLAAVGGGALLSALNRMAAGEDDDGVNWYDKVPDFVKEHNLVIMKSLFGGKPGEYWNIPLPYGYNIFYHFGAVLEGVTRGNMTAPRAAGSVTGSLLGAFNPLGREESQTLAGALVKNAAPTLFRPVLNVAMNENFMGLPVYNTNFPSGTPQPDSELGRHNTPEFYKAFARWLNTATGGSPYRSGVADLTPEVIKHWVDFLTGGAGRFVGKTVDTTTKAVLGLDIPDHKVPFLGRISGQVLPWQDQKTMYDRFDAVRQADAELKALRGADRTAFLEKQGGKIAMKAVLRDTEKRMKGLRKRRETIYADTTLSRGEQAARIKEVEKRMKAAVNAFNLKYREVDN